MVENSLLRNLLTFYDEDPDDPFNAYALALEYIKYDRQEAGRYFDILLYNHPDYLPTYYHAAEFFSLQGNEKKTEEIYTKGIALALNKNNIKAHQELSRAYKSFLDDLED